MNEQIQGKQKNETMGENSFMKKLMKKRLNQKGLTLIELLAVIVILAIVAAIAVPAIGSLINNSRIGAVKTDGITAINASSLYFTDNANVASPPTSVTVKQLVDNGYLESKASLVETSVVYKVTGGNKISGSGATGGMTVIFGATTPALANSVSIANINAKANSERDAAGGSTLTITP